MSKLIVISANYVFLTLLGVFTVMLPFGTWQANPAWILLFARISTLAFTNVHFTSIFAVSAVTTYLVIRDRKTIDPFRWVAVVFAGAGLHEWMLYLWNYLLFAGGLTNFWKDATWFASFIVVGFAVANRRQRFLLGLLAAYLFVLMGLYVAAFHNSELEIGVYTTRAVSDNFIEVLGWVTTALAFLL